MLSHSQNEPFKFTINTLKKIVDTNPIEKESDQLKSCLNSITQINNLSQLLNLALDSHAFNRLAHLMTKLYTLLVVTPQGTENVRTYENLPLSPQKSKEKHTQQLLKHSRKIDLTPSTKKSGVLGSPSMCNLIEELVENLQKFDEIKRNSKRFKWLISQVYDELITEEQTDPQPIEEINLDRVWRQLSQIKLHQTQRLIPNSFTSEKCLQLLQLLQQIQIIYKFMQVLKITTNDIFSFIEPKNSEEMDQHSQNSYNLEAITKKSNHPSEQRSLLTEMLRDSSQKSNLELPQNQYITHIVLRPKFKQYSQNQTSAHLDQQFKLSYKSAKPYQKYQSKLIRSEMNYYDGENNENDEPAKIPIRRKQVKIKRSEMSCSRCQIF